MLIEDDYSVDALLRPKTGFKCMCRKQRPKHRQRIQIEYEHKPRSHLTG